MLRPIQAGLRRLLRRDAVERDLDDEVRHYLEMATAERIRAGMSPEAAARAARVELGGIEPTKEQVRSGGWEAAVDGVLRDVRYALRALRRNPAFVAIAVLTLALGTGANTVMFSVVNTVMLRPLPYHEAGRLVLMWTDDVKRALPREATASLTITDWKTQNRAFSDVAYYSTQRIAVINGNSAGRTRARSAFVSDNLFEVLGVPPLLGRTIAKQDADTKAPVVVISHAFWQRSFNGDPDVIGKALTIEDAAKGGAGSATVIGVMPAGFYFPDKQTDIWTPATTYWRFARESVERFSQWARRWTAVARLAPGVSAADARADMARVGRQLEATYKSDIQDFPGFSVTVTPVLDAIAGTNLQSALWVLFGATALVLLVACANVANLLLAQGAARQHEFAVRRALGGGRGRLLRQLAVENVLLALLGGAAGVLIATWGIDLLRTSVAAFVPRIDELALDRRVLVAATMASLAAALVFGTVPALRLSAIDAAEALKEGGRGTASMRGRRSRGLMVLAECALAIVLLAGAGLLLRSLNRLLSIEPGFDPRGVLTLRVEFPSDPPPTTDERLQPSAIGPARARVREQAMQDLVARVQTMPGVDAVALIDDLFINGSANKSITIPGRPDDQESGELNNGAVSPDFFKVLRVPLRQGRFPIREDAIQKIRALWQPIVSNRSLAEKARLSIPEPVVVNDAFVQRFYPGEDPIGRRFCIDPTNKTYWYEIVGVVGNMHRQGLDRRNVPEFFGPYYPTPNGRVDLLVRTQGDPLSLAATIRQEVLGAFPAATVVQASTADAQFGNFSAQRRFQTWLLSAFALLALFLAAIGIFGLVHYMVAERSREMGVRIALGATRGDVLRLVIAQGMRMPAAGIAIGLAASAALTRLLTSLLFEVGATDPVTFAAVPVALSLIAVGACYTAARRTLRVDPLRALRQS